MITSKFPHLIWNIVKEPSIMFQFTSCMSGTEVLFCLILCLANWLTGGTHKVDCDLAVVSSLPGACTRFAPHFLSDIMLWGGGRSTICVCANDGCNIHDDFEGKRGLAPVLISYETFLYFKVSWYNIFHY